MKNKSGLLYKLRFLDDGKIAIDPYGIPGKAGRAFAHKLNKIISIRTPCQVYVIDDDSPPTAHGKRGHGSGKDYVCSTYYVSIGVMWLCEMNDPVAQEIFNEYHERILGVKP